MFHILTLLSSIVIALVVAYLKSLKEGGKPHYTIALIIAIVVSLSGILLNYIGFKFSEPVVDVTVAFVKKNEMLLNIKTKSGNIESMDISCPVFGKVVNVLDASSNISVHDVRKYITGDNTNVSLNRVEISTGALSSDEDIEFTIIFLPIEGYRFDEVAGADRFSYRYIWMHNGNSFEKKKYRMLENNKEIGPPDGEVISFCLFPFATDNEMIKENYYRGIPKRPVEALPFNDIMDEYKKG